MKFENCLVNHSHFKSANSLTISLKEVNTVVHVIGASPTASK